MRVTKKQLRKIIIETMEANRSLSSLDSKKIRESEDEDGAGAYDMWQQRQRDNPHPHDKETWDEERKRLGKASPVDDSPETQKMVEDVLDFIETIGMPNQVGDANRYTVRPIREIEIDFHVKTRGERRQLIVKVMGTSDFVPSGGNYDAEDLGFVAENMTKIVEILNALAGSGLPIHSFSIGTMR